MVGGDSLVAVTIEGTGGGMRGSVSQAPKSLERRLPLNQEKTAIANLSVSTHMMLVTESDTGACACCCMLAAAATSTELTGSPEATRRTTSHKASAMSSREAARPTVASCTESPSEHAP